MTPPKCGWIILPAVHSSCPSLLERYGYISVIQIDQYCDPLVFTDGLFLPVKLKAGRDFTPARFQYGTSDVVSRLACFPLK
ncbi:hypothetical protein BDQ94DRAFT_141941 [Aspergillus welwitschiae]|uniref:Uncharacterized protein n=1 Tax=Aspergillus welwitschiae TaxID=1341132 RepID=A0A3F3Q558_9EURO|nr:hypothetical protein BDQ94DRAFT_141941 [Aspergillus welwitschiae]RDH34042.1 hypothetical protein BDQ94DRAFT_141941 [Aspergillus welwitschiae]